MIRFGSLLLLCAIAPLAGAFAERTTRPNIVLVLADDLGWSELGCYGNRFNETPNLDRLAGRGMRFTHAYAAAPVCSPYRAALLTGQTPARLGITDYLRPDANNGLPPEQVTLPEILRRNGYATGMAGKWHLGPPAAIVRHGFDDVYFKQSSQPGWANFDLDGKDRPPGVEHSRLYHVDANNAAACAFIKRHPKEPFFFYCAYRAPHVPLDAPPKYLERFPGKMPERRRQALAMRWLVEYSRSRPGKSMKEKLANEIIDAANERGESVKKREDTHRMAEANKAFAHYRW